MLSLRICKRQLVKHCERIEAISTPEVASVIALHKSYLQQKFERYRKLLTNLLDEQDDEEFIQEFDTLDERVTECLYKLARVGSLSQDSIVENVSAVLSRDQQSTRPENASNTPSSAQQSAQLEDILSAPSSVQQPTGLEIASSPPSIAQPSTQFITAPVTSTFATRSTITPSLSKLEVPRVSGHRDQWVPFRDLFVLLVHSNEQLDDIQRFHYFRASVAAEAESLMRTLPVTTTNYQAAWNTLKETYDQTILVVESILKKFLSCRPFEGNLNDDSNSNLWTAYCYFHCGNYKTALSIYETLYKQKVDIKNLAVNIASCYFYLGMYDLSEEILRQTTTSPLNMRLNFHISHKLRDDTSPVEQLQDTLEDQLSLAAIHYLRAHYQEAIHIYKRLLLDNLEAVSLNVYVALCYYKMDYYDVSQEVLSLYLNKYSDSVVGINLKACNTFKLYNGAIAENELLLVVDQLDKVGFTYDLLKHNMVVFKDGENAMQVLPHLVGIISEARLNLVIYYLRNNDVKEAFHILGEIQPAMPQEYILKAVVNVTLGQTINSMDLVKTAEECFRLVGSSASECDTIHGRQCMAAVHFLLNQFEDVVIYLTTVKSYLHNDDTFNFNYAQAKAACNQFKEAEESLLIIHDLQLRHEYMYILNLARCYVINKKPQEAWELHFRVDNSPERFNLLLQIANDCYRMGEFWYAAKAFDVLDRIDPNPEFWEGIRGAIVGVFQRVVAKEVSQDILSDVLQILKTRSSSQANHIAKIIRKWCKEQVVL